MNLPLREARDADDFLRNPVGASLLVETTFAWCVSPSLGGATAWGSPGAAQTRRVMRVLEAMFHPSVGPQLDVILDGHLLDTVDPAAVLEVLSWARRHLRELRKRVRLQIGVAPPGVGALLLAGTLPLLGDSYPHRVLTEPRVAYRMLLGERGDALFDHIWSRIGLLREVAPVLGALRGVLRARDGNLTLVEAARLLKKSSRALQRELAAAASSFRAEQREVRIGAARELLSASDDKLAVIAERLGLSEDGLNLLVRERLGITPEVWRRQLKSR